MCTRFVYNGNDTITGFNLDIDPAVWHHQLIKQKGLFAIGIKRPDGQYHSYHGVNSNGNVGTLLFVHGNEKARREKQPGAVRIGELTEMFVRDVISFDEACQLASRKPIVYDPGTSMQALLSDRNGRSLIIEPGIGYRLERTRYSLITNYSVLDPRVTEKVIQRGDDRFERANEFLRYQDENFSIDDAINLLDAVHQKGKWGTRVSFAYSVNENRVYYALNHDFRQIYEYQLG
jgi:hypothetical protein